MSNNNKHITNNSNFAEESKKFFSGIGLSYTKTKNDVWTALFEKEQAINSHVGKSFVLKRYLYAAAIILLLISTGLFSRLYTRTINCPAGSQLSHQLPDNSKVSLNASSELSYHPIWWHFERTMHFKGEGFFEVQKGSKFSVISPNGTTSVMGTSFTIYDRTDIFKVTCITGKVKVENKIDEKILEPDFRAELNSKGSITVEKSVELKESTAWLEKQFYFTSTKLDKVFNEISLRYGINISMDPKFKTKDLYYSGNFPQLDSIENVLTLVCEPFNLTFKQMAPDMYTIVQKQ